jgi:hypothetical protein
VFRQHGDRLAGRAGREDGIPLSGYPADVLPRHAAQVESFEYLPKPIQPGDLLSRLEALIR